MSKQEKILPRHFAKEASPLLLPYALIWPLKNIVPDAQIQKQVGPPVLHHETSTRKPTTSPYHHRPRHCRNLAFTTLFRFFVPGAIKFGTTWLEAPVPQGTAVCQPVSWVQESLTACHRVWWVSLVCSWMVTPPLKQETTSLLIH